MGLEHNLIGIRLIIRCPFDTLDHLGADILLQSWDIYFHHTFDSHLVVWRTFGSPPGRRRIWWNEPSWKVFQKEVSGDYWISIAENLEPRLGCGYAVLGHVTSERVSIMQASLPECAIWSFVQSLNINFPNGPVLHRFFLLALFLLGLVQLGLVLVGLIGQFSDDLPPGEEAPDM